VFSFLTRLFLMEGKQPFQTRFQTKFFLHYASI
jgi:hypothetical protein